MSAFEQITGLLQSEGISFAIHEHAPVITVQEAADKLPFPLEQFLPTIAFRLKNGGWVLAARRAIHRVDYKKLATALEVSRSALVQPSPEEVEEALGFEVGGVCPLPLREDVKVVFDTQALEMTTVFCGAGRRDRTLGVNVNDLVRLSKGIIQPIVQI